ncbi:oxidoreductase [Aureococcus anophagefferens]|nr:oxidoreductase [Aureococcus anophagefferens]
MMNALAFHLMKFGPQRFPLNPESRGAYTYEPCLAFLGVTLRVRGAGQVRDAAPPVLRSKANHEKTSSRPLVAVKMKSAPVTTMMATYLLLLPAAAWALGGSVTPVAPAAPVAPAVASTATRVGSIVARIQNALDEACATEAASAGAAPAPLAVGALATACGRRELAARLRAKHYAVLRLPGFDGGRLRAPRGVAATTPLLRVGGAAPVAPDRPAEFVGVFGGDGPGRFAEGRYGGDGAPPGLARRRAPLDESRRVLGALGALLARALLPDAEARVADDVSADGGRREVSTTAHRLCRYAPSSKAVVFGAHTDTSFFTLVPLSSPPGLEVFDPSLDAWVRPEAAEGAEATDVLCMPGEFLELASAGAFRAVVHRVLGGPTKRVSTPLLVRGDRRFGLGGVNAHDCWRALQEREPDRAAEAIRGAPAHVDGASYVAPHRTRAEAETFYSLAFGRAAEVLSADPLVVLLPAFASHADCAAVLAAASRTAWLDDAAAPADLALRAAPSPSCPAHAERWRVDTYGPATRRARTPPAAASPRSRSTRRRLRRRRRPSRTWA